MNIGILYIKKKLKIKILRKDRKMDKLDYAEVKKHINILNVAYHLCLEIVEEKGYESKAICPFCGYNKNSKIPTLILNSLDNKYICSRCGAGRIFYRIIC